MLARKLRHGATNTVLAAILFICVCSCAYSRWIEGAQQRATVDVQDAIRRGDLRFRIALSPVGIVEPKSPAFREMLETNGYTVIKVPDFLETKLDEFNLISNSTYARIYNELLKAHVDSERGHAISPHGQASPGSK